MDVAHSVVHHLEEEVANDRVAPHGIELRRVRVVVADGANREDFAAKANREDFAAKARREFERELAASKGSGLPRGPRRRASTSTSSCCRSSGRRAKW